MIAAVKERPILFSAPMVRALLDGSKTQTRRIVKPFLPRVGAGAAPADVVLERDSFTHRGCPYGQPGHRLWVRETWAKPTSLDPGPTVYRADYPACVPPHFTNVPAVDEITWKPSIHMFRADSRILLEVVSVRVERLDDCSEADARAEGVTILDKHMSGYCASETRAPAIRAYRDLWDEINGAGAWAVNPWVWCIEFRRVVS